VEIKVEIASSINVLTPYKKEVNHLEMAWVSASVKRG